MKPEAKRIGHASSGMVFPKSLGEFQRGELHKFDAEGLDISAIYTRFHLRDRLNAQIYVFPATAVLGLGSNDEEIRSMRKVLMKKHFEGVKETIVEHNPGAKMVMEDPSIIMLQGKEGDAITAHFIYIDKIAFMDIQFFTSATLIAVNQWLVLFRLTAPDDSIGRSMDEVGGFYQGFAEANGGQLFPRGYGDGPINPR